MGMSGKAQTYGLYTLESNFYPVSVGMNPFIRFAKFSYCFSIDDRFIITITSMTEFFLIVNSFLP